MPLIIGVVLVLGIMVAAVTVTVRVPHQESAAEAIHEEFARERQRREAIGENARDRKAHMRRGLPGYGQ